MHNAQPYTHQVGACAAHKHLFMSHMHVYCTQHSWTRAPTSKCACGWLQHAVAGLNRSHRVLGVALKVVGSVYKPVCGGVVLHECHVLCVAGGGAA